MGFGRLQAGSFVMSLYPSLAGLRILVVEDDLMVAMMIEEMVQGLGCEIVATVSTQSEALQLLRSRVAIDGVLLDLHLHGISASPIVDALTRSSVPFIITSGSDASARGTPAELSAPRLLKPFNIEALARTMAEVFGAVAIDRQPPHEARHG